MKRNILKAICIVLTVLWLGHISYGKTLFTIPAGKDGVHYKRGETSIAWGPSAFAVAQDESFWIADTVGNFLLHYDKTGTLLTKINLSKIYYPVVGVGDIEVTSSGIFILDIAAHTPKIIQLSFDGVATNSYEIPENLRLANGLTGIAIGENNEILIEIEDGVKVYQLVGKNGEISQVLLDGYTHKGRLYSTKVKPEDTTDSKSRFIIAGDIKVKVEVANHLGSVHLLKIEPDDCFYVSVEEVVSNPEIHVDQTVRYYSSTGKLLSQSRIPIKKDCTYVAQNLAVGPNKSVYVMSPRPEGIQIKRLRFSKSLRPILPTIAVQEEHVENLQDSMENTAKSAISRQTIYDNASQYITYGSSITCENVLGTNCSGRKIPNWQKREYYSCKDYSEKTWIGWPSGFIFPYNWGGFDSIEEFDSKMESGKAIGNTNIKVELECAAGVDCSGLVSRAFGLSTKYSTRTLPNICKKLSTKFELKLGDILLRQRKLTKPKPGEPGGHVVLFVQFNDANPRTSTGIYIIESTTDSNIDGVTWRYTPWKRYKGYTPYSYESVSGEESGE